MKVTLNSHLKHDGTRFERHTAAVLVADQAAADAVIAQGGKPLIATPAQREAWLTRGLITVVSESDSTEAPSGPSEPDANPAETGKAVDASTAPVAAAPALVEDIAPAEPTAATPEADTPPPDGGTKAKGKGK